MAEFADLHDLTLTLTCSRCHGHGYLGGGRKDEMGRLYPGPIGFECPACEGSGIAHRDALRRLEL